MQPVEAPAVPKRGPFRLGVWEVYPDRNLLTGPGGARHLEPKVMELLVLLTLDAGEVVSKDAIADGVWEGRIIAEGTITNAMAELRQALGDDARAPRYVETIPKRGYRLVASVEALARGAGAGERIAGGARFSTRLLVAGALVLTAAAIATIWLVRRPSGVDPLVVLVAPFANRTGDAALDPIALRGRDGLSSRLSTSGLARAVPAAAAAATLDLAQLSRAAREARAGLAISGDLYLSGGEIEVQARLVDATRGALLYAVPPVLASRERAASALEEAESRILGALATHLTAHAHSCLLSRPPLFEAYREFIVGSELFPTDLENGTQHLQRAVEIDPEYTSALIRLAIALRGLGRNVEGRAVLARLEDRRAELNHFERLWLAWGLATFDGRPADGLAALREIQVRVPSDPIVSLLIAGDALALNRPREAIATLEPVLATSSSDFLMRHPMFSRLFRTMATARHMAGDPAGALAAARAGRERFPTSQDLLVAEARALVVLGDVDGLEAVIDAAVSTPSAVSPATLLVEAAATARAFKRPALAQRLARRAQAMLDQGEAADLPAAQRLLLAQSQVLADELDRAQAILATLMPPAESEPSAVEIAGLGWLGAVAARRGDLATAQAATARLAVIRGPQVNGASSHFRAAIAAWMGRRDDALALLRSAQGEGWTAFHHLHDRERVLFEPLEGMAEFEAMLHPTG